jgi:hypothetical protein
MGTLHCQFTGRERGSLGQALTSTGTDLEVDKTGVLGSLDPPESLDTGFSPAIGGIGVGSTTLSEGGRI